MSENQENNNIVVCEECGSDQIEEKAWVKVNGKKYVSDFCFDSEDMWCPVCEEHTNHVTKLEYESSNPLN